MADGLTTIANIFDAPRGAVLFGAVWGFFKGVESILADDTKLEIAVWLLGVKVGQKMEPWPDTFTKVFDRVFGKKHLSWKCLLRSALCSFVIGVFAFPFVYHEWSDGHPNDLSDFSFWEFGVGIIIIGSILPDYLSLLETRYVLSVMQRVRPRYWPVLMALDLIFTISTPVIWVLLFAIVVFGPMQNGPHGVLSVRGGYFSASVWKDYIGLVFLNQPAIGRSIFPPAILTSIWLWLYAASGFILKAAQRFDLSFGWFISKADIEKKPLSSIGLVAGALVAIVYWTAVIVSRVVG